MTTEMKTVNGKDIIVTHTHHPFLHPTKGWRNFARPGKANRRRKLIPTGVCMVPESRAARLIDLQWSPCRHQMRRRAKLIAMQPKRH